MHDKVTKRTSYNEGGGLDEREVKLGELGLKLEIYELLVVLVERLQKALAAHENDHVYERGDDRQLTQN